MNTLKIDDKWAIEYDPVNNDSPMRVTRYGENAGDCKEWNNLQTAMFYALLEARLPSQAETLAWAVIDDDGTPSLVNYDRLTAVHLAGHGEQVVRVAIRRVEDEA